MNREAMICLESNVYCSITTYKGNVYVSFREFVSYDVEDNLYPTKVGITLNKDQYNIMVNEAEKFGHLVSASPVGVPFGKSNVTDLTGNKTVSIFHGYTPTEETLYILFEDTVKTEKKIHLTPTQYVNWLNIRETVAKKIEQKVEELKTPGC